MRKLASIQTIKDIQSIPKADVIDVATVNGWKVVVKKDLHSVGDKIVYCEVDSFLPIEPEFEFLRKTSYKKMSNGQEGFRLKTITMRGQVSQGLIIPLKDAQDLCNRNNCRVDLNLEDVGSDVTDALGIIKYERPIPAMLEGVMKGDFPSFIKKTDQERVQNLEEVYDQLREQEWVVTEKLDGTSATFYLYDCEFGVCSRNIDLLESEDNTFWKVARDIDLKHKMRSRHNSNYALQGELIGEGIQGNPYKIKGQTVRFFSGFEIDTYSYCSYPSFIEMVRSTSLTTVPILEESFKLPPTIDELLEYAEGKSILNEEVEREGVVLVNRYDGDQSFKVISNKFLLNNE